MIKFKDFFPSATEATFLGRPKKAESLHNMVKLANNWIDSSPVEVINIETIVLPGGPPGTRSFPSHRAFYYGSSNQTTYFRQGIRVWYRESE